VNFVVGEASGKTTQQNFPKLSEILEIFLDFAVLSD
jgi:hypothetical protein